MWKAEVRITRSTVRPLRLEWDWVEIADGVICVQDPHKISANVDFLDSGRYVLPPVRRTTCFMRLLHGSGWEDEVLAVLAEVRGDCLQN